MARARSRHILLNIDAQLVIAVVLAAPVVLVVYGVGRMLWRMTVRNEVPEAGGSQGRQMVDRADN